MTRSLNDYADAHNLDHYDALLRAEEEGLTICKHADPTEGAREGLTADEASDIAAEDPALIYLKSDAALDYLNDIDEQTWERVCGDQDRPTFARLLALDEGQSIEDAWAEAIEHAEAL